MIKRRSCGCRRAVCFHSQTRSRVISISRATLHRALAHRSRFVGIRRSIFIVFLILFCCRGLSYSRTQDIHSQSFPTSPEPRLYCPEPPTPADYETLLDFAGFFWCADRFARRMGHGSDADHVAEVRDKDLVLIGARDSQPLLSNWAGEMPLGLSGQTMQVNEAAESTLLLHPEWPFRSNDGRRLKAPDRRRCQCGRLCGELYLPLAPGPRGGGDRSERVERDRGDTRPLHTVGTRRPRVRWGCHFSKRTL